MKVYVLTRNPAEHDDLMAIQSENEICYFESLGVQVFLAENKEKKLFHRKLAIIDRKILWARLAESVEAGRKFKYLKPNS